MDRLSELLVDCDYGKQTLLPPRLIALGRFFHRTRVFDSKVGLFVFRICLGVERAETIEWISRLPNRHRDPTARGCGQSVD